jgi:hypothetical protein
VKRLATCLTGIAVLAVTRVSIADPPACDFAFDPDAARHVFEDLRDGVGADGCRLDELRTDRTRMTLRWTKGDAAMPDATIDPAPCAVSGAVAGDTLALAAPPALASACPDAVAAMTHAVRTLHPPTKDLRQPYALPFGEGGPGGHVYSRTVALLSWAAVALALLGSLAVVVLSLRRAPGET